MNRSERRQQALGRKPVIVALPTLKKPRLRKRTDTIARVCNMIEVTMGCKQEEMADLSKFVVRLMEKYLADTGNTPLNIDPSAPMLVAWHKVTREPLGFCSVKLLPPGTQFYVENFHVVGGRLGRLAARALLENLYAHPAKKVAVVRSDNAHLLDALGHYGMRVVGYFLEGPYLEPPAESVAAERLQVAQ